MAPSFWSVNFTRSTVSFQLSSAYR